jgi:hypothetical protein
VPQPPRECDDALFRVVLVIGVAVLASTLTQPTVLARIPIQNLLKNGLRLDRSAVSAFFFWVGLPWYFKPVAGLIADTVSFFGSRRRSYILAASILGTAGWVAFSASPHDYGRLLSICLVTNAFLVVISVVVGAYVVEESRRSASSGRLSAIRQAVQEASILLKGPGGGFLAGMALGVTGAVCAGVTFVLVPVAFLLMREHPLDVSAGQPVGDLRTTVTSTVRSAHVWMAAGLLLMFYAAPGFDTALFYKQQNDLHLDIQSQGGLQLLSGLGGVAAAAAYGFACRRFNLRTLLVASLVLATAVNLGYTAYGSIGAARIVEITDGFGFSLAELALTDLAVRASPRGAEGLAFSLLMSVRNVAFFATDWFGSFMLDHLRLPFEAVVVSNSTFTLITAALALALPATLVRGRDRATG